MIQVAVIDAQGGGLGRNIIEKLIEKYHDGIDILALGTNVIATTAMKKAGAARYATGENAIVYNADKADYILGGIGLIAANGMLGEITPKMANAVSTSPAVKILIPVSRCNICIPGVENYTVNQLVGLAVEKIHNCSNS